MEVTNASLAAAWLATLSSMTGAAPSSVEFLFICIPSYDWVDGLSFFFILDGEANSCLLSVRFNFLCAVYRAFNKLSHIPQGSSDLVEWILEFFQISTWSS